MNSQHMVVPDTHDSVRSHSCGCCSFSHSLQGLLQLTQGWKKIKRVILRNTTKTGIVCMKQEIFSTMLFQRC